MSNFRPARLAGAIVVAIILALVIGARPLEVRAATPSSGTLSPTSGPVVWNGFSATAATAINGEEDCVEGSNCDTFVLKLAPANYTGFRVRYNVSWTLPVNDYDVYVHAGALAGTVVSPANGGAPATAEQATFDINAVVTAGVNDTYVIRVVYWTVAGGDPYRGELSLEAIPPVTEVPARMATIVSSSKTGIAFTRNRTVYAFGAGQDVEPSVRIDYQGNMYAGGIRGLTGGNDIWRFDLNPTSPTAPCISATRGPRRTATRCASPSGIQSI